MFESVARPKASKVIEDEIRVSIIRNKLRPGDRLASERELADSFGVSRQTLREALSALESLGLIALRKGSGGGAYVAEVPFERPQKSLIDFLHTQGFALTPEHVSDARMMVEPYAARMAARFMTAGQKERLASLHAETTEKLGSARIELQPLETAFHHRISACVPNPLIRFFANILTNIVEEAHLRHAGVSGDLSRQINTLHGKILNAILDKNPDAAERAMYADLVFARNHWENLYQEKSVNEKAVQPEWVIYGDRLGLGK